MSDTLTQYNGHGCGLDNASEDDTDDDGGDDVGDGEELFLFRSLFSSAIRLWFFGFKRLLLTDSRAASGAGLRLRSMDSRAASGAGLRLRSMDSRAASGAGLWVHRPAGLLLRWLQVRRPTGLALEVAAGTPSTPYI